MKSLPIPASAIITSLAAALCHSTPINAANAPNNLLTETATSSQIQSSHKPKLMLAKRYQTGVDLQHYWISEKLDGVRAYWNGRQLLSRQGYPIHAPLWFTQALPDINLDTELWIGRGKFEAVSAAVRRYPPDDQQWRTIQLRLLDLPTSTQPFIQRIAELQQLAKQIGSGHIDALRYQQVDTEDELQTLLKQQVTAGAEGLMLNRIDALYQGKRTDAVLKLKLYQDDEAVVLAHLPGKGKYQGLLGSVLVQTRNGQQFRIGSGFSDQQRRQPPPIGSTISFKYFGLTTTGKPRFASFLRQFPESLAER